MKVALTIFCSIMLAVNLSLASNEEIEKSELVEHNEDSVALDLAEEQTVGDQPPAEVTPTTISDDGKPPSFDEPMPPAPPAKADKKKAKKQAKATKDKAKNGGKGKMYNAKNECNIRAKPNKSAKIIGQVKKAKSIWAEKHSDKWFKVHTKSGTGYINKKCI